MSSAENLPPQVMPRLARELRQLATSPPDGIRFVPNDDNLGEILADLSGPEGTPYESGVFRVKLVIGREYPTAPPKGYFLTKIFHPNVSECGEICVNTLKRDWTSGLTISHVLKVIWCLLVVPFPESALNEEAGKLFMDSYDEYARLARLMTGIHARPAAATSGGEAAAAAAAGSPAAAAPAGGAAKVADKSKEKAKKKALRRL